MHDTEDAIFHEFGATVQKQADRFLRQLQISYLLLRVNGGQLFDGLQLEDNAVLNDQVGAKSNLKADVVPDRGNLNFARDISLSL